MKKYLKQLRYLIFIQIIFHILYSGTNIVIPLLNKILFDEVILKGQNFLILLIIAYLITIILNSFFQYISQVYEWKVSQKFYKNIKKDLVEKFASLSNDKFKNKSVVEYVSILDNDIEVLGENYIDTILDIIKSILSILVYGISLIMFVDLRVALVIIFSSSLAVFIPKLVAEKLSNKQKIFLEKLEKYFQVVNDIFSAKNKINKETFKNIMTLHSNSLNDMEDKKFNFGKFKTFSNVTNGLAMFIIQLSSFSIVGFLLLKEEITVGAAVATFSYVENFIYPIRYILTDINLIHSTKSTRKDIENYLQIKTLQPEDISTIDVKKLTINNLYYSNGSINFENLNYTFEKNKKYALIGKSGSGKSTLLKILSGEIKSTKGILEIVSKDNSIIDKEKAIFYLNQFEHLYKTNLENNITLFNTYNSGKNNVKKLYNILEENIKKSILSENPMSELSGGEKNVVSLMRSIMTDKPIILLDEPTANMDKKLANKVLNYILNLENKIIIVVLHEEDEKIVNNFDEIIRL